MTTTVPDVPRNISSRVLAACCVVAICVVQIASSFNALNQYFQRMNNQYNLVVDDGAVTRQASMEIDSEDTTQSSIAINDHHVNDGHDGIARDNNQEAAFAGCLMWKDDNHHLVEWLAYHYQRLPLRRLIVCIDSTARTTPEFILRRYSDRNLMNITIWRDDTIFESKYTNKNISALSAKRRVRIHRDRQRRCMRSCFLQLHNETANWSWVTSHDVDEYLVMTTRGGGAHDDRNVHWNNRTNTDGSSDASRSGHMRNKSKSNAEPNSKTIWNAIQDSARSSNLTSFYDEGCIPVARPMYGARDILNIPSNISATAKQGVLDQLRRRQSVINVNSVHKLHLNESDFMTYRWQWRTAATTGGIGKGIVDLSKVNPSLHLNTLNTTNPHRPIKALCSTRTAWTVNPDFQLNHYVGSAEQWSHRDDPRAEVESARSATLFHEHIRESTEFDGSAGGWLEDFVNNVGVDVAMSLLEGAGKLSHQSHARVV